jgi:hypothetical protein
MSESPGEAVPDAPAPTPAGDPPELSLDAHAPEPAGSPPELLPPAPTRSGYPPELFLEALTPHTATYETIQSVLLWRRPIAFAVFYLSVQLLFLFIDCTKLGFLSVVALVIGLGHVAFFVCKGLGDDLGPVCFPPIDASRVYPLEPFCRGLSRAANWIADAIGRAMQNRTEQGPSRLIVPAAVCAILFGVTVWTGTFVIIWITVSVVLLLPGIVMHPWVFPLCQKLAAVLARPEREKSE